MNMRLYQSSFSNYWQIFQIYTSLFVFFDFPHFYDELILCRILFFLGTLRSIPQNLLYIEGSLHFSHLLQIYKICLLGAKILELGWLRMYKKFNLFKPIQIKSTQLKLHRNLGLLINQQIWWYSSNLRYLSKYNTMFIIIYADGLSWIAQIQ